MKNLFYWTEVCLTDRKSCFWHIRQNKFQQIEELDHNRKKNTIKKSIWKKLFETNLSYQIFGWKIRMAKIIVWHWIFLCAHNANILKISFDNMIPSFKPIKRWIPFGFLLFFFNSSFLPFVSVWNTRNW